ncbi:hypothetical protein Pan44_33740 [Caulifigura coniformis]|uniref:Stigma-specific protein, Stig1 n=1 Tax=Caulifigura coniformis TaxID=2527983 RepID=A0A517SGT2_9PLAN|nr:hypothetical protein [Caulifigura coniformis]QDT55331.1 hypothetical protein Pan44_33740 [Caulifigura coniformis]
MNVTRLTTLCAAAAAMISLNAPTAQAQGLFGGYNQSYPVYTAPAYTQPCATGNCGVRSYTTNYGVSPCATGNCPTTPYTASYPTATCPTGTCPTGQCIHGAQSSQCRTICGPNGCQTICPTGGMQCGPNGCVPAVGYSNTNYRPATASTLPSLNLDQAPAWNTNNGFNGNMNTGFNGASSFGQVAPNRTFGGQNFQMMNTGYAPAGMETNIANDPMVRLN